MPRDETFVGQWVVAMGIGFGDAEPALTAGIISAASRISAKAIQTDANLSPANYGGPLVDLDGRIVGICVPLSPGGKQEGAGAEWYDSGIGFAVPIRNVQHHERGRNHAFGADGPVRLAISAIVQNVQPDSPAAKTGL
jgi:serine protease Do